MKFDANGNPLESTYQPDSEEWDKQISAIANSDHLVEPDWDV